MTVVASVISFYCEMTKDLLVSYIVSDCDSASRLITQYIRVYANMFVFCVSSLDECRNIIIQYGVREVTASQVARVLGMMARTHSGLTDGIPLQVRSL